MESEITWKRIWAMPNRWTFKIKPIMELLEKYEVGTGWIDPFSGKYSPAEFTNDLNPEHNTRYHLEAIDFMNLLYRNYNPLLFQGAIFDPPYSLSRVAACYKGFGLKFKAKENPTGGFPKVKDLIAKLLINDGMCISFGWNSVGMGKKRGFEIIEGMNVCHGGNRNDTIVVVERKL